MKFIMSYYNFHVSFKIYSEYFFFKSYFASQQTRILVKKFGGQHNVRVTLNRISCYTLEINRKIQKM